MGAIRNSELFTNALPANDDESTGLVDIGFIVNFSGILYEQLYVNNNGNITFDSALGEYTPFDLSTTDTPIIAPFFADVDTRSMYSELTYYGAAIIGERKVFGVNWIDVGYYSTNYDKLNSFQLILTDRSDINIGDFDIEFNYDKIQWETGDASEGVNGLGGFSARVGWSNGVDFYYELFGSAINGALLDGGIASLVSGSSDSGVAGRYIFQVRSGEVLNIFWTEKQLALEYVGIYGVDF